MNIDNYNFSWIYNEPKVWSIENAYNLKVTTEENTDFWKDTWYGFNRFSGHVYGCKISTTQLRSGFTFQVKVNADFKYLYDQAGVIVVADESHWLKAGIEFNDDHPSMSSVLTNGMSDWATSYYHGNPREFWMRITMINNCLRVQYSSDGKEWPLLRLCPFQFDPSVVTVGAFTCTPQRSGLNVVFSDIRLIPPLSKDLHDLS